MASQVLATFTKDEIEHYHRESKLKFELDIQSRIVYAKRQAIKQNDEKWQKVVTKKDAKLTDKDAEIEQLRLRLAEYEGSSN